MSSDNVQISPSDPELIDRIVNNIKARGIFDQFRKDCLADVDTKPAYQNLQQRVNGTVSGFLASQKWHPGLNKNQLRENLRKHTVQQPFLEVGVDRIVDQVVNPKMYSVFMPKIEDIVYEMLGIEKPKPKPLFPNYRPNNRAQQPSKVDESPIPLACSTVQPVPSTSPQAPSSASRVKTPEPLKIEEKDEKTFTPVPEVDDVKSELSYSPITVKDEIKEEENVAEAQRPVNESDVAKTPAPEGSETMNNEDDSNTIDEMPLLAASMDADSNQASVSAVDSAVNIGNTKSGTGEQPDSIDDRDPDYNTLTNNLSSLKSDEKISPTKKFDNFSNLGEKLKQSDVNLRETSTKKEIVTEESSDPAKSFSDRSDSESTNSKIDLLSESNTSLDNTKFDRARRRILSDSSDDSNSESVNGKVRPSDNDDDSSHTGNYSEKHSTAKSPVVDRKSKGTEEKRDKNKSSTIRTPESKSKRKDEKEKTKSSHDSSKVKSDKHKHSHHSDKSVRNDSHKEKNENKDKNEHREEKKNDKHKKEHSSTPAGSKKHSDKSKKDDDKAKHISSSGTKNDSSSKHDKYKHRSSDKDRKGDDKNKIDTAEQKSSNSKSISSKDESKKRLKEENKKSDDKKDKSDKKDIEKDKAIKDSDDKKRISKKKRGHCDEDNSKSKNSRRSSDRDSNGGAGPSTSKYNSSSTSTGSTTNSSSKKSTSRSDKGRSKNKSSSSKESVEDVNEKSITGEVADEVDLFLRQISESIADDPESNDEGMNETAWKPKIASNFSEMKKIMQDRKSNKRTASQDVEGDVVRPDHSETCPDAEISEECSQEDTARGKSEPVSGEMSPVLPESRKDLGDSKHASADEMSSYVDGLKPCVVVADVMDGPMGEKLHQFGFVDLTSMQAQYSPDNLCMESGSLSKMKEGKNEHIPVAGNAQNADLAKENSRNVDQNQSLSETENCDSSLMDKKCKNQLEDDPKLVEPSDERKSIQVAYGADGFPLAKEEFSKENQMEASPRLSPVLLSKVQLNTADNSSSDRCNNSTGRICSSVTAKRSNGEDDALGEADSLREASTSVEKCLDVNPCESSLPGRSSRRKNAGSLMYAVLVGLNEKVVVNKRDNTSDVGNTSSKKRCIRSEKTERGGDGRSSKGKSERSLSTENVESTERFGGSDVSNKENKESHVPNAVKNPRADGLVPGDVKIAETRLSRRKNLISSTSESKSGPEKIESAKECNNSTNVWSSSSCKTELSIAEIGINVAPEGATVDIEKCSVANLTKSTDNSDDLPDWEQKNSGPLAENSTALSISSRRSSFHPGEHQRGIEEASKDSSSAGLEGIKARKITVADKVNKQGAVPTEEAEKSNVPRLGHTQSSSSENQTSNTGAKLQSIATHLPCNRISKESISRKMSPICVNPVAKRSDSESSGEMSCTSEETYCQNENQSNTSGDSGFLDTRTTADASSVSKETTKSAGCSMYVPPTIDNKSTKDIKFGNNNVDVGQCCKREGSVTEEAPNSERVCDDSAEINVPSHNAKKTAGLEKSISSHSSNASALSSPAELSSVHLLISPSAVESSGFFSDSEDEFKGFPLDEDYESRVDQFKKWLTSSKELNQCHGAPKRRKSPSEADSNDQPAAKCAHLVSPMKTRTKRRLANMTYRQTGDVGQKYETEKVNRASTSIISGKNESVVKKIQASVNNVKTSCNLRRKNSQTGSSIAEKQKKLRNSQSYSETDLYKPRPQIGKETDVSMGSSPANKRLKKGSR